jgi:glycosyltransferase involved in cell wall biosynthesis
MRLLCVHQGYELYGSDRAFIESVAALRTAYPAADIEIILPRHGPIVAHAEKFATRVSIEPIWVLRRHDILKIAAFGWARLIPACRRAMARMRAADLVYINTVVIVDFLLAAHFCPGKVLVHVHEIPESIARPIFRTLLLWSHAELIFNSQATKAAFAMPAVTTQHVVYNSIAGPSHVVPLDYDASRPLRLLMVGRINRIKGQDLLIEALTRVPSSLRSRFEVRIIGGAFANDAARERALRDRVQREQLGAVVRFEPFCADMEPLYRWADVVCVPSRRPESLGRVAIEAMSCGRPVIAAAIGGLVEIVEDRATGRLFAPNNASALAALIVDAIANPGIWRDYGLAARSRYQTVFGERGSTQIREIAEGVVGRERAGRCSPRMHQC